MARKRRGAEGEGGSDGEQRRPWFGGGPEECAYVVVYDIESDRVRTRVADACRDYGLMSFQYSAFTGRLPRGKARELHARLLREKGDAKGNILVVRLCDGCLESAKVSGKPLSMNQVPFGFFT